MGRTMSRELILDVRNLSTTFRTERGPLKAIDGIDFQVYKGEILGIVGESGCRKKCYVTICNAFV